MHFDCTARTQQYGHDTFISLYCFSKLWFSSFWSSKSFKEIFVIRKLILSLCYPTYNKKKFIISFPLKSGSNRFNAIIRALEKKFDYYIELRTTYLYIVPRNICHTLYEQMDIHVERSYYESTRLHADYFMTSSEFWSGHSTWIVLWHSIIVF